MAACALIWVHTFESPSLEHTQALSRFGLPFFFLTSLWLVGQSVRRSPHRTWASFAWQRTRIVYGSFLLWNVVYLAARFSKHLVFHQGSAIELDGWILLAGTSLQLWFMPVILMCGLLAFPIVRWSADRPQRSAVIATVLLVLAIVVGCLPHPPAMVSVSANHWVQSVYYAGPSILAAIAMAVGYPLIADHLRGRQWPWIGAAMLLAGVIAMVFFDRQPLLQLLAGSGAFLISLTLPTFPGIHRLATLGRYAFGVYLVHSLWVELLQVLANRVTSPAPWRDVAIYLTTIVLSTVSAILLQRSPLMLR